MDEQTSKSPVELPPLTNWEKAPTLMELKQDLQDALPSHERQCTKINEWLDNLNVTGKAAPKSSSNGSTIVPKLIRKQAEWRYAALSEPFLSTPGIFKAKPVTWEDKKAAQQTQLILNHQFNSKLDKVRFIDEYVRTAVDEGTVVVHTGWCFEQEEQLVDEPLVTFRINPEFAEMHQQIAQLKAESPSQYATDVSAELKQAHDMTVETGQPHEPIVSGTHKVKKMVTVKNHPTAEICDYRSVVIDPTAGGDISKAGFAIRIFESSKSVLRKYGNRYKNLEHINVEANTILNAPDTPQNNENEHFNFNDDARKKFFVYEYWGFRDIHGTGHTTLFVASWVGDVMIRMEEKPVPDNELPFVVEQYLPVRKRNYGEPDGALLEDNQKVIGAVTRGMIDILGKSANGQTGMRKDMLDVTNRRKFEKGLDYEFNGNVPDPRMGIFMHTYPEIPASAQFMLQLQNIEAESLTGVKAFANSGISGAGLGEVATSVRGALDAASKRELGILRRLSNGIIKIGRKFMALNAALMSEEEIVRITNDEFVTVRRDDLSGKIDLELSISTAEEDDNKAQELAFMFQTLGPNADIGMTKMILADIARLRKMPDLAHKIEQYNPQPDPLAQRKAELEIQLLEAQLENELADAAKKRAEAQLSTTKVGTETAKQGVLNSDRDQRDLNFIEQESGVQQERDLQKQREQAKAQGGLKLLEAHLKEKADL